jgi:hypothetical protein
MQNKSMNACQWLLQVTKTNILNIKVIKGTAKLAAKPVQIKSHEVDLVYLFPAMSQ